METLKNYKIRDFLKLKNYGEIEYYLSILGALKPSNSISNINYRWWNKQPKKVVIESLREHSFGDVTTIRQLFSESNNESIFEAVSMVTDIPINRIGNIRIIDFYSTLAMIKKELIELATMEMNELSSDDSFDINLEAVNANQRMAKFGVLNVINSLAQDDLTKWDEIQKMPYMTVFTKLKMDHERIKIQKEISELQNKRNK